jgi:hypothetical protein
MALAKSTECDRASGVSPAFRPRIRRASEPNPGIPGLARTFHIGSQSRGTNKEIVMTFSKMVNDRQRATRIVVEAALTHAGAVGARLDQVLAPPLLEEGSGGTAGMIRRLGRTLLASAEELVAADRAHEAEKADDTSVRRELEEAIEAVYREVVDFRTALEAVGGVEATVNAGLTGITPREPIALGRLARALHDALPRLATVPATRRGLTFDPMSYTDPLDETTERLERAQAALRREERELEATLMIKNRVMATHDARFLSIARLLESLFRLAGFEELANRVRPSARRPGQIENDPDAPSVPGGEASVTPAPGTTAPDAQ